MIVQHIVFPSSEFNPVVEAYMRLDEGILYRVNDTFVHMDAGLSADFNTYFNGFSVSKWQKYTKVRDVVLRVYLKGHFLLRTFHEFRQDNQNQRVPLAEVEFDSRSAGTDYVEVDIPHNLTKGIVSFSLCSLEDGSVMEGGYFYTRQDSAEFRDVSFAVDICTFKREEYLNRNLELLARTVFAPDSEVKDKFEIFISDNGQSFVPQQDYGDRVHVFPNKNAGGAGGFGRSMIEILRSPNYPKFTHIIMMDDDIVLCAETLYRTYVMARTIKDEYRDAFVGGAMLCSNEPNIQSENMDLWMAHGHRPIKYRYDITNLSYVLKNEIEDKGNYFGWWYCVMPIGVVKANNLPLPIFIKRDDIEYGVRNGRTFITLNGLCVLHEAFGNKRQGYLEYYYWRNMCILNAIHYRSFGGKTLKRMLLKVVRGALRTYRYDDANLALTGVEDFLKGVDWLKETDVEALNRYVLSYTYRAVPVQELPIPVSHGNFEQALVRKQGVEERMHRSRKYRLTHRGELGWCFRAKKGVRYVSANAPYAPMLFRAKTVVNFDEENNKAFITQKSYRQAKNLMKNYRYVCKLIDKNYEDVKQEYNVRYRELISLNFWDRYLGLQEPMAVERDFAAESAILNEAGLKKVMGEKRVLKKDRRHLWKTRLLRLAQRGLFWLPKKQNRISFYLHERRGYVCNLKYMAQELLERYGDQAELVWITRFPETCHPLEEMGVRVVRLNTIQHWFYQFTSKVVVVNDAFPEGVVVRHGQFTVNTWHAGMNYKRIGPEYVHFRNKVAKKLFAIRNRQPDLYLSGSGYFTQDTSASFHFDPKVFAPTGLPRNDVFFRDNTVLEAKIKRRYALPQDCKLVLYAPTFRLGYQEDLHGLDFGMLVTALSQRFGGDWKVLYRKHYFVRGKDSILDHNTVDVSDYDDMNELLAVSDVLISDYSSCLWDFALTGRPSFVYATDIDDYHEKDRDFSYPLEKWPYPIARDNQELEEKILAFDQKDFQSKLQAHLEDAQCYDDGHAAQRAVDLVVKHMKLGRVRQQSLSGN